MKKYFIAAIFVLTLPMLVGASEPQIASDFSKANASYRAGKYDDAIRGYEAILNSGQESGPLYYNCANSYFKNKQLGRAILNYERARKLMPRDPDLFANYRFALSSIPARVDAPEGFLDKLFKEHDRFYTVDEMILIISILLFLFGIAHLCGMYFFWAASRVAMIGLGCLLMVFVIGLGLKVGQDKNACISVKAAAARFEPNDKATVYFELPEGQNVYFLSSESGWAKVERPDGKIGWVKGDSVEKI